MNILNKLIINNSEDEIINVKLLKEPLNLINKDISNSKTLLENFFKRLNESSSTNNLSNKNNNVIFI